MRNLLHPAIEPFPAPPLPAKIAAKYAVLTCLVFTTMFGWYQLLRFASQPGPQSAAPQTLTRSPAKQVPASTRPSAHLIAFIHPQCACTHATLQQLDTLLDSPHPPVQLTLAVYQSAALDHQPSFEPTQYLHHPFDLYPDRNGDLARRFGAATSGELLLYSPQGTLLFQGGITAERAHIGDNDSADALRQALQTSNAPIPARPDHAALHPVPHPVYGCSIFPMEPPA